MGAYLGKRPQGHVRSLQDASKDELSQYILQAEKHMDQVGPEGKNYLQARSMQLDALHEMRKRESK